MALGGLVTQGLGAAPPDTSTAVGPARVLCARFERTRLEPEKEQSSGRIFFGSKGLWRVDHLDPLQQTIVSTESLTTVLYPKDKLAFRIRTPLAEPPSLLFFLVYSVMTNKELAQMGLDLAGFTVRGDTTVTSWNVRGETPPAGKASIEISRVSQIVVRIDVHGAKGRRKTFWVEDTATVRGAMLPAVVQLEWRDESEHGRETIRYQEVKVEALRAEDVFGQRIPDDYRVTTREW